MPLSRKFRFAPLLGIALVMTGCDSGPDSSAANSAGHTAPTATTEQANRDVLDQRPFDNRDDLENARRGLIAQDPELVIDHLDGGEVWYRVQVGPFQDRATLSSAQTTLAGNGFENLLLQQRTTP